MKIGIIGHGMVGNAVDYAFKDKCEIVISDPAKNNISVVDLCNTNPDVIFVSVPTPTDDTNYSILTTVLDKLKEYKGLVVVKSTVPAKYIESYDIVYNPEFLSRATAINDFINPPFVLIGSKTAEQAERLQNLYINYSIVKTPKFFKTTVETASLAKYTMNCFYALKVTYMNAIYDVASKTGADYETLTEILKHQPWMGSYHFRVPGADGIRGFGGPCLPKDTAAMVKEHDIELLKTVLTLNNTYRDGTD